MNTIKIFFDEIEVETLQRMLTNKYDQYTHAKESECDSDILYDLQDEYETLQRICEIIEGIRKD